MGTFISRRTLIHFKSTMSWLIDNEGRRKAIGHSCSKTKIKIRGYNLDEHHRSLRIMAKHGYIDAKERGSDILYTMNPRGIALYDSLIISEQL